MSRLVKKLGFKGLTLHGLRHTFLTRMAAKDISLEKVRRVAGHASLITTQQYLHVSNEDLRRAVEKTNDDRVIRLDFKG